MLIERMYDILNDDNAMDVRHIPVQVAPMTKAEGDGSQLVEGWHAWAGRLTGDLNPYFPTRFMFVSVTPDWAFAEFPCGGETHPGIAVFPKAPAGAHVCKFENSDKTVISFTTKMKQNTSYHYQLVLWNAKLQRYAVVDPSNDEDDQDGGRN